MDVPSRDPWRGTNPPTHRGEMRASAPLRGSAPTTRLRPWRTRFVVRRARVQWQLALVVTAIAVLACTLISSLGLLVAATELGAVRGALTSATDAESSLSVTLKRPTIPLDEARATVDSAAGEVIGTSATSTSQALALSELYWFARPYSSAALLYLGEFDDIDTNTSLTAGEWPTGDMQVAIPDVGADALGLAVGDKLAATGSLVDQADLTLTISGIFHIDEPETVYWSNDLIDGAGLDPNYPVPGTAGAVRTDAIGPVIVPSGTFDGDGTMVERFSLTVVPDFSQTTVETLAPLQERLAAAAELVPAKVGDVGYSVDVATRLTTLIGSVTATMAVTRSIVVVVSLLLFVLAVAALSQAARLLTEARMGERHLMRARGASNRQVLGLAAGEALLIAVLTAAVSPFLARGVYIVVAQQPAMVAAGMAVDPGIPPLVWVVAIAIGALFWLVLVAPMLGREASFQEGEQGNARQKRLSGLQRSGVDIALLVLAAVAYSQLLTYQGPTSSTQFGVDPILVGGPALVLLAGAFLAVRLIPAAGTLTERIAARSRGAVVSLAAWEIGRRAQRATAAILLITLALAVGTFSHAFLATWRQSQIDQAAFALGAPLRLTTEAGIATVPQNAQPVIREAGAVAGASAFAPSRDASSGEEAAVLGLTAESRDLLLEGRLGDEGGTVIAEAISKRPALNTQIELPDDTLGISAVVSISSADPLEGVATRLRLLAQDEFNHQFTIDMGTIDLDGKEHQVTGTLADDTARNGLSIVGFQLVAYVKNPTLQGATASTRAQLSIRDLNSMGTPNESTPAGGYPSRPLDVDPDGQWRADGYGRETPNYPSPYTPDGSQVGLAFTVPNDLASQAATYALTAWATVTEMPAVLSQPLADALDVEVSDHLTVFVLGSAVSAYVADITPAVPGGGASSVIGSLGTIGKDAANTIVLDQVQLARALFQAGESKPVVHEWWMSMPEGDAASYLSYLAVQYDLSAQSAELVGTAAQEDPLRVATQGALWLVILGSAALAAVGFAVHATGSLRSRATEFAQLRAVGLSRRRLVGIIGIESLLLCILGTFFGIGIGLVLAYLVGPLVGVSADGTPPVPSVVAKIPVADIALLAGVLAAVLAVVVLVAARVQRVAEPASALRRGEER